VAGHGAKLERRQEAAIAALLSEPTVEAAARKAKVAYSTLKGWLRLPEFQAAYRQARADVLERTVSCLLATCGKAVERLARNLDSKDDQAANRAALGILDHAVRGVEATDVLARLEAMERALAEFVRGRAGDADAAGETADQSVAGGAAAAGGPGVGGAGGAGEPPVGP